FVRLDVTRSADWAACVAQCRERGEAIDVLVNNAGINQRLGAMHDVDEAQFQRLFEVNLKSIYLSAQHVVPLMREQGQGGAIVNNTSIAAIRPRAGQVWYSGLKSAAVGI